MSIEEFAKEIARRVNGEFVGAQQDKDNPMMYTLAFKRERHKPGYIGSLPAISNAPSTIQVTQQATIEFDSSELDSMKLDNESSFAIWKHIVDRNLNSGG